MATQREIAVQDLQLDLANYRTMPQSSEADAIKAIISTKPDRFWALMESLIEDGYLPTETILVLESAGKKSRLTVKEGNRRVAAMKLIHGLIDRAKFDLPANLVALIDGLGPDWKAENTQVPCMVFPDAESTTVDKLVTRAHGKNEKTGRDQWNAVAKARHNRDAQGASEPALDLLEKYLRERTNITGNQATRWAGDFPLTVLEEALKRLAPRLGLKSAREIAETYPAVPHRDAVDSIVKAIGQKLLGFEGLRDTDKDFAVEYGIPPVVKTEDSAKDAAKGATGGTTGGTVGQGAGSVTAGSGGTAAAGGANGKTKQEEKAKSGAESITDPKRVKAILRAFTPVGSDRAKVVLLRDEAVALNLQKNPLAFCFLLRSMFEISAKAYCKDHKSAGGPTLTNSKGQDKKLAEVLRDITKHLTKNNSDKVMVKQLHGAMAVLGSKDSLLSVTSMNQLVHNPTFSVTATDISVLFSNVFPLLEAMNA